MPRTRSAFERLVAEGYLPGYLTHDTKTVFLTPLLGNRFPIFLKFLHEAEQIKILTKEVLGEVGETTSPAIDGVDYRHMQCFIDGFVERLVEEEGKWAPIGERLLETMAEEEFPKANGPDGLDFFAGMSMCACLAAGAMSVYYEKFSPPKSLEAKTDPNTILPTALLTHLAP